MTIPGHNPWTVWMMRDEDEDPFANLGPVPVPQKGDRLQWQEIGKGLFHGRVKEVEWYFDNFTPFNPRVDIYVIVMQDAKEAPRD